MTAEVDADKEVDVEDVESYQGSSDSEEIFQSVKMIQVINYLQGLSRIYLILVSSINKLNQEFLF